MANDYFKIMAEDDLDRSLLGTPPSTSSEAPYSKVFDLVGAREQKLQGLAEKTGVLTTGKGLNTASAAELQQAFSDTMDQQLYDDGKGGKYQEVYTNDPVTGDTIITKVPYREKSRYGNLDVENLYVDTTAEGNYKLGLARPDTKPGITPYDARYMDKRNFNPYTGKLKPYDGRPGPRGVTPKDGALLDVALPRSVAEQFEYFTHSNVEQIRNRAMGTGPKSDASQAAFGSGQTEYTTPNAPMWNQNYDPKSVDTQITKDTALPQEIEVKGIGNKTPSVSLWDMNAEERTKAMAGSRKGPGKHTSRENVISGFNVRGGMQGDYAEDKEFSKKMHTWVNVLGGEGALSTPKEIQNALRQNNKGKLSERDIADISNSIYKNATGNRMDPTLLTASIMLETDRLSSSVFKQNKNLGGVTWTDRMAGTPGIRPGTARPSSEKGRYVKYDTWDQAIKHQVKAWENQRVRQIDQKDFNDWLQVKGEAKYQGKGFDLVNTGKLLTGGVLDTAQFVSQAPKKLYEFLGGDYLEGKDAYSQSVKAIINYMDEGGKYIQQFNEGILQPDKANIVALQNTAGRAFDEGNYVSGILGAAIDNPAGILDLAANMYGFSKAMSKGLGSVPVISGALMENVDEASKIFQKEYGRDPNVDEQYVIFGLGAIGTAFDVAQSKLLFDKVGGSTALNAITKTVDDLVAKVPNSVARAALGAGGKVLGMAGTEGIQEGLTEASVILGGTQDLDKATKTEYMKQLYEAAALGAISGPGMVATNAVVDPATDLAEKAVKATFSPEHRKMMIEAIKSTGKSKQAALAPEVGEAGKPQQMSAEERITALEQAKAELLAAGKTLTEEENQMFDEEIARLKSKVPWKTPKEALEALDKQDNGRRSQGYVYATKVVNTYKQTDVGPETPLDTALEIIKANSDLDAYYDEVGMKRPKKDRELATHNSAANKIKAALQQRIEQLGIQGLPEDEQFDALEAELDIWTRDKGPEAAAYKEALMGPMVELLLESKTFGSGPEASGIGSTFKIKIKGMTPTKETPSSDNTEAAVESGKPTTMKIKIKGAVTAPTKAEATVKVKEAVERKVKEVDTIQVENIDTPTHSGVSARSIQKLAKVFGTSPKKVQSALDISFQKLLIKKMGTVSKEANEAQYNIYYGDDGILTNFVKYKKALQDSKTEDATKAWMRIVNRYVGQGYKGAIALKAIAPYSEKVEAMVKAGATLDDIKAAMKDVRVGVQGAKGGDIVGTLNGTDIIKLTDAVPEEMRNSIEFSKEGHVIEAAIESAQHIEGMAEREGIALPEIKINQRDRAELRNKLVREAKEIQAQIDELEALSGDAFKEMSKEELKAHSELKNKVEKLKKQLTDKLGSITKQEKFAEVSEYQYNNVTFAEEADVSSKVGQSMGTVTAEEAERLGVDESMVEEFVPTKSSSEYKELIRELEALKKARAKLQTTNQEISKEEQTGKELYKKLQAELKEAAEVLGDATVAPVKSAVTAATTADKIVRDLTNNIRKLKGDKKGLEKALEFLEKNEQAFEGITLDVVKLREVQKAFNAWLRKDGHNASVKAQNEKLRELAESRTVVEKIVKTADKIAKMGIVFARRLMGLPGNLGDKTLVGATKEGIAKIERLLEDAEKKLQKQKQAKTSAFKDAVKAVMDIRKQANMTGESLLSAKEIKRVLENASTVDKLRRRTYKSKELTKDRVRTLTKLINEKEAELKGVALFKSQLGDNLEVIKDWKIEAKGKGNSLDFKKLGKFGSILANLPIEAIKTLFDEKGVEARLLSTIAGNTKGLVDKALYMNKAMPQNMLESVLAENPALMLLGKVEQDGERYKVVPNLEMLQALRLVTKNYLAVNESKLMYNDDLAISKIIGVSEYNWKAIKNARKALKEQGQLLTITASRIGDDFVRAMGISQGELGEEAYRKLVADLGNTALLMAEAAKEVTYEKMDAESWNKIADKKIGAQAEVLFIHVTKAQKNKNIKEESLALQQIDKTLQVLNRQSTYRTHPIFAVQNEKDDYTIDGSPSSVPEKSKAVLRVLEDQEYKINVPALDAMLEMYAKDKEAFMGRSGWKKLPEDALQDDVDAQESKNREIEDTMEKLVEMMQAYKNGELSDGVFFNWFFSSNGRYMIDAVGVNPQSDKHVTRWILLPKEAHDVEWNLADKNAQKLMYDGIAQAFGWDIDKKHPDETKAFAEKIIEEFNKDPKAFEAMVRNGEETLGFVKVDGKLVTAPVEEVKKKDFKGIKAEMPHVGHAFIAVEFMKNMKGKKRFRGTLVAEYDAKTSGPMHKLMQWPILQDEEGKDITAEWFNKGAITLDGKELENGSSAAHIQNTVDGYQTVTLGAVAAINAGMPTASEYADYTQVFGKLDTLTKPLVNAATGAVEKAGRELGKQAFVPFGYGSSTKTIQDNVGMTLAYDLLRRVAAANDEEAKKVVMDTFGMSDAMYGKLQEALRTTPTNEIKLSEFGLKKDTLFKTKEITVIGMLSEMFSMTYGEAYKQAMESKFGKHVAINNTIKDVTSAMFRVWKARYDKEIAKKPNATAKEKMEIIRELEEAFPLIRAPWSENRLDGVAIFETKRASMQNEVMPTVRTAMATEDGGMTSRSVQAMITEMEEVFAAGAVLPIHWIDGSQIGTILAEGGVQGVHDAIVLGIPTKEGVGKIARMNKAMYDINANYNLLEEFQFAFTRMLAGMSNEEIDAFVAAELEKVKANKKYEPLDLADIKETLGKIVDNVNAGRKEYYSKGMIVGNIIAFEGTEYDNRADLNNYKDLDKTIESLFKGCE